MPQRLSVDKVDVGLAKQVKGFHTTMRQLLICTMFLTYGLFSSLTNSAQAAEQPVVTGESAILIDAATGTVLYEKNADKQEFPASITKIATGIYAIENGNPDDIVTVSKKARYVEGTRVYLGEGEQVPLRKLEYGLLMHSGNDAAIAIAEHMAGSEQAFAERVNAFLVEKVGVSNTHFTNPHGLHDPQHYTTAADMAKIAMYAMRNDTFRTIVGTNRLPWDGREWKSELINHNKLLRDYAGATGIKNGFTDQAMHTLVGSAKRGNTEFIAVTMRAASSPLAYKDVMHMLDYGFANYETKELSPKGTVYHPSGSQAEFLAGEDLFMTVPIGSTILTEVTANGQLKATAGTMQADYLLAPKSVPVAAKDQTVVGAGEEGQTVEDSVVNYSVFAVWVMLSILLVGYTVWLRGRRRRNRQRPYRKIGQP